MVSQRAVRLLLGLALTRCSPTVVVGYEECPATRGGGDFALLTDPDTAFSYRDPSQQGGTAASALFEGGQLTLQGTVRSYFGWGVGLGCVDAANYDGVSFGARGNLGQRLKQQRQASLQLQVATRQNSSRVWSNQAGTCASDRDGGDAEICANNWYETRAFNTPHADTGRAVEYRVPWTAFTSGRPLPSVNGDDVLGVQFEVECEAQLENEYCSVEIAIGDIGLYRNQGADGCVAENPPSQGTMVEYALTRDALHSYCWENTGQPVPPASPLEEVKLLINSSKTEEIPFDFCIEELRLQNAASEDLLTWKVDGSAAQSGMRWGVLADDFGSSITQVGDCRVCVTGTTTTVVNEQWDNYWGAALSLHARQPGAALLPDVHDVDHLVVRLSGAMPKHLRVSLDSDINNTAGDNEYCVSLEEGEHWDCRARRGCVPICGDGSLDGQETCDDGNNDGGRIELMPQLGIEQWAEFPEDLHPFIVSDNDCTQSPDNCTHQVVPVVGEPLVPTDGQLCMRGETTIDDDEGDDLRWGTKLEVALSALGDKAQAWSADGHAVDGFSFDIEFTGRASEVRVGVYDDSDPQHTVTHYTQVDRSGSYAFRWTDLQKTYNKQDGTVDPGRLFKLQFLVASREDTTVPFDFCISKLALNQPADGCSRECRVDSGYECPIAAEPCIRVNP